MADGDDCKCCACCIGYCSCGADWTSQEVYDLRSKVSQIQTEVEELQKANSELLKRVLVLTEQADCQHFRCSPFQHAWKCDGCGHIHQDDDEGHRIKGEIYDG